MHDRQIVDNPLLKSHLVSRRQILKSSGVGFGMLGLSALLAEEQKLDAAVKSTSPLIPKQAHHTPRAKHVIFLFMNGGPSHVDTFDPKPELKAQEGKTGRGGKYMPSPFSFAKYGEAGIDMSE